MKNVLFITYFWPPSGKASVHWPLFIIKHLPQCGWQPFVLTADEDTFSHPDESLLQEVDPHLTVVKTSSNDPFRYYRKFIGKKSDTPLIASETISLENKGIRHRLSIWIRMNLFIPDARIGWTWSAPSGAQKILRENKIDAIVTIGPPHSTHLIGKRLSKKHHIPFIPVLIDPWVDIVYYRNFKRSAPTRMLDNYFERTTFEQASKILFVTQGSREDYITKYPWIKNKAEVLYWGYNEESFAGKTKMPNAAGEEVILHAGNIFDYQNPIPLWRNIKKEIENGKKLRLRFIGTVGPEIKRAITEFKLDSITEYKGFLPYSQVVQEMLDATYLLVCPSEKRHVPGKLFEYLRTGNKIIAFSDGNDEVKNILHETDAGKVFGYDSADNDLLGQLKALQPIPEKVQIYSREKIAYSLSKLLG
jgi:glycosyltransferase involved in cell wall biosynthesis